MRCYSIGIWKVGERNWSVIWVIEVRFLSFVLIRVFLLLGNILYIVYFKRDNLKIFIKRLEG